MLFNLSVLHNPLTIAHTHLHTDSSETLKQYGVHCLVQGHLGMQIGAPPDVDDKQQPLSYIYH